MTLRVLAALAAGFGFTTTAAAAPVLSIDGVCPASLSIEVSGATPSGDFVIIAGDGLGASVLPGGPCTGVMSGIGAGLRSLGSFSADATGNAFMTPSIPRWRCDEAHIQVVVLTSCELSVATPLVTAHTEVFGYTGSVQFFTVPAGVTSITVTALGASGGAGDTVPGLGGLAEATLDVDPGDELEVWVGGEGETDWYEVAGGFNGGGGVFECCGSAKSGAGGGASDVRGAPYGLDNRLIVAGGGGGGADFSNASEGGHGGGTEGGDGVGYVASNPNVQPGTGGTQTEGGSAYECCGSSYPNENGRFGQGGACWHDAAGCGGGGGGWFGGGAGSFAGGGGGSSYVDADGNTDQLTMSAENLGDGYVIISY